MQPQSIMEEQESRRELYDGLKRMTQREQTYLLYRYGFTDGKKHPLIGTAIYFHLTKGRAKKTEEQAMDNLWLELPWWFIWMGREELCQIDIIPPDKRDVGENAGNVSGSSGWPEQRRTIYIICQRKK